VVLDSMRPSNNEPVEKAALLWALTNVCGRTILIIRRLLALHPFRAVVTDPRFSSDGVKAAQTDAVREHDIARNGLGLCVSVAIFLTHALVPSLHVGAQSSE
jgi:hypothetical protein